MKIIHGIASFLQSAMTVSQYTLSSGLIGFSILEKAQGTFLKPVADSIELSISKTYEAHVNTKVIGSVLKFAAEKKHPYMTHDIDQDKDGDFGPTNVSAVKAFMFGSAGIAEQWLFGGQTHIVLGIELGLLFDNDYNAFNWSEIGEASCVLIGIGATVAIDLIEYFTRADEVVEDYSTMMHHS